MDSDDEEEQMFAEMFEEEMAATAQDSTMHQLLQDDLVEHIWRFRGNTN
jgi:hypothetical protein